MHLSSWFMFAQIKVYLRESLVNIHQQGDFILVCMCMCVYVSVCVSIHALYKLLKQS